MEITIRIIGIEWPDPQPIIDYYENIITKTTAVPKTAMNRTRKTTTIPDIRELEASSHRAMLALAAPVIETAVKATIRMFERSLYEAWEIELANRNIEYAQALTDYAQ